MLKEQTLEKLYPPTVIYYDDNSRRFYLELDGFEYHLMLTNAGANIVNYIINNTSTYLAGTRGSLFTEKDCMIFLTNDERKPLEKIAKELSNDYSWRDEVK